MRLTAALLAALAFAVPAAAVPTRAIAAKQALGPREQAAAVRATRRDNAAENKTAKDAQRYGAGSSVTRTKGPGWKSVKVVRADGTTSRRTLRTQQQGSRRNGSATVRDVRAVGTAHRERVAVHTIVDGRLASDVVKTTGTRVPDGNLFGPGYLVVDKATRGGATRRDLDGKIKVLARAPRI